jgi:hypothetical protein
MSAARESDQADFDLERFIDMFDEAMTSKDPRVVETLRNLMMIVTLTRPETHSEHNRKNGPLRRLFEDMHDLNRSMSHMQDELRAVANAVKRGSSTPYRWEHEDKYTMKAAAQMAQSIDEDVMRDLSQRTAMQINGGVWPKGTLK